MTCPEALGDGVCRVCSFHAPPYSCPRCNARYCSSGCYQAHSEQCTEAFARDHAVQELLGMTAADDDDDDDFLSAGNRDDNNVGSRAAMLQVLKRIREADAAAPLDPEQALVASLRGKMTLGGDDEEDEEEGEEEISDDDGLDDEEDEEENAPLPLATLGITLSRETSRRLRELHREYAGSADGPPEEAIFAALSEEERLAFFEAVAEKEGHQDGEEDDDQQEQQLRFPWWLASDPLNNRLELPALSKDGTALVSEIGGESDGVHYDDDEDDDDDDEKPSSSFSSFPPPPPSLPLPRLASLLPARANGIPAPGIESTVVYALYGYCWAMRRCRGGEWRKKRGGKGGEGAGGGDDGGDTCSHSLLLSALSETALLVSGLSQPPQPGVPPPPLRAALAGCVERAANDVTGTSGGCSALPTTFATGPRASSSSSSPAARRASAIAGIADVRVVLSEGRAACVLALEDLRSLLLEGAAAAAVASSSSTVPSSSASFKVREEGQERGQPSSSPSSSSPSAAAAGGKLAALRAKRAAAAAAEQAREMRLPDEKAVLGKEPPADAAATNSRSSSFSSSTSSSAACSIKIAAKRVLFLACWANEAPPEILSTTAKAVSAALEEAAATVPDTETREEEKNKEKRSALELLSPVSASTKNGASGASASRSPSLLIEEL